MISALEKANILTEALPYIQAFTGKTIVIKYGGHAMVDSQLEEVLLKDIILMKVVGMNPVVVHGGGPLIDAWLQKLNIQVQFIDGLRITNEDTVEIVEMVLAGKVNKGIVRRINQLGGNAVGLCGTDARLIEAKQKNNGRLGLVGEVVNINTNIIDTLTGQGFIPVVAPVGAGPNGETLNINADDVAGALGGALRAHKLVLLTDVEGIYLGEPKPENLASRLTVDQIPKLIDEGIISGGMIPKVKSCLAALQSGVKNVHIVDGRKPHSLLLEIFTKEGIGTMVMPS